MKVPEIERGCSPTRAQELVESLVYAVERAMPGMHVAANAHVTHEVNVAMADLCLALALHINPRAKTVCLNGEDHVVGIKLSEGMVLTTRFTVRDVTWLSTKNWVRISRLTWMRRISRVAVGNCGMVSICMVGAPDGGR